jgi:hypothetical protein
MAVNAAVMILPPHVMNNSNRAYYYYGFMPAFLSTA